MEIKDLTIRTYIDILEGNFEAFLTPGVSNRLFMEVQRRFKNGASDKYSTGSFWGAFCAIVCQLRVLCCGDIENALNIQPLVEKYGMAGDKRVEHYIFGRKHVFVRTVGKSQRLKSDFKRVLDGCTQDDSLETVLTHLYWFVEVDQRDTFKQAARYAFGVCL